MLRALLLLCAHLTPHVVEATNNNSTEGRLYQHLLSDYEKEVRPGEPSSLLVTQYQLNMFHLVDVNEKQGTWELIVWVRVKWIEDRMKWKPSEWEGIKQMQIDASKLWTPSFLFYQQVSQDVIINTAGYIGYDGSVFWSTPTRLLLNCVFSLESFPNDEQHCPVFIEGWNYHGLLQDLRFMQDSFGRESGVDLSQFSATGGDTEWVVSEVEMRRVVRFYPCCEEPWPSLQWNVTLSRSSLSHVLSIVIPYVGITYISFFAALLTPKSGERIGLTITCLLALVAVNFILNDMIPMTRIFTQMSFLYLVSFIFCMLSMVESVVVINLESTEDHRRYNCCRAMMNQPLSRSQRDELMQQEKEQFSVEFKKKANLRADALAPTTMGTIKAAARWRRKAKVANVSGPLSAKARAGVALSHRESSGDSGGGGDVENGGVGGTGSVPLVSIAEEQEEQGGHNTGNANGNSSSADSGLSLPGTPVSSPAHALEGDEGGGRDPVRRRKRGLSLTALEGLTSSKSSSELQRHATRAQAQRNHSLQMEKQTIATYLRTLVGDDDNLIQIFLDQRLTLSQLPQLTLKDLHHLNVPTGTAMYLLQEFELQEFEDGGCVEVLRCIPHMHDWAHTAQSVDRHFFIVCACLYTVLVVWTFGFAFDGPFILNRGLVADRNSTIVTHSEGYTIAP